jgi:hypothetical protein
MFIFLDNILKIHRSGLIEADSEELRVESDGCLVSWCLKDKPYCKIFYKVYENSDEAAMWLEGPKIGRNFIAIVKTDNPLPPLKDLEILCETAS